MSNITIIPARPQRANSQQNETEKPKLRVAAYCRVSTDSDEQATSYEAQVSHYTEQITRNSEWAFAGIYADDGISGTNTKKREEFNRMIADCMDGKIDMIITKSISRFARNTLDCLKYIRQLKERNIPVFFEKENINTLDAKGEVLLTIMASLAQQESQSLSQNVKLGLQFRYQRGEVQVNHSRFLGYTKDENGRLVIDPDQAEVVRRIYREYLDGYSTDKIAAGLECDGILTGAGNPRWHTSTVAKILRNEKYMGDALLQKTYTVDYLSKKRIKNNGIMPQYYVENDHEAIIPKEIFMRVQDELVRRRLVKVSPNGRKHGFSSNHVFSQMIVCGECGELFRRVHWNNHGCRSIVWRCVSRLQPASVICHARTVNEEVLKNVVVQAFNELLGSRSTYQKRLRDNLARVLCGYEDEQALEIDKRLAELQQDLINHASRKEDYNDIADEIFRLREMKQKNFTDTAVRDEQVKRINELNEFIEQQDSELTEFDESLARRWLKEIVVWDDRFSVELKSGIKVDVER